MKEEPFFSDQQRLYDRRQPHFHDVATIDGVQALEAAAAAMRAELHDVLSDPRKRDICFRKWTLKKMPGWQQIELKIYGVEYPQRTSLFPVTMNVLRQIPGMATAYFSHMAPHSVVPPHTGDTDAYYRVHLGLKIPAALPTCGIEVAGEKRSWEEGKCLAFNDIYFHTTWNDTDQERVVLIVDILRPEFRDRQLWVDAGVRATLYWARLYERAWPLIELFPRVLVRLGLPVFHRVSYGWHRIRQRRNARDIR